MKAEATLLERAPGWDEPDLELNRGAAEIGYRGAVRAFGDLAAAVGSLRDQDELLHLVATKICELVGVPRCSIYLRDGATDLFRGQVGRAARDIDAAVKRLICGTEADGFTREIVETRAPVVIRNARSDLRPVRSAMRDWDVAAMMGVPMVGGGGVIGLIFLDAEGAAREFTAVDAALAATFADLSATAILQSRLYNEVRSSRETVTRQNEALRRAAALDDKLTGLVLEGCSLTEVAATVSGLTQKPCAIHDADNRQVAGAVPGSAVVGGPPALLDAGLIAEPEIATALVGSDLSKPAVVGPIAGGRPQRLLFAPVTIGEERWGTLVLGDCGAGFGSFDVLIGRRAATVIALEMSAERRAATSEWNARSALAGALIEASRVGSALESRAQFLGVALQRPHVLCLLSGRDAAAAVPDARALANAFARAAPELTVLAAEVAEGTAAIVELPASESDVTGVQQVKALATTVCRALDPGGRLVAGLSTACHGSGDYARAYKQAREVKSCLDAFASTDILSADDLGAARLFLAKTEPAEIDRFARETLGALVDPAAPPELLVSLRAFFEAGRSVRRAAVVLGVHQNTVRYRLAKVEEVIGLPVAIDPDAQLSVQIALLVLKFRGSLPPAPVG